MKEDLIQFETAKLAKEKRFFDKNVYNEVRISQSNFYDGLGNIHSLQEMFNTKDFNLKDCFNAPTQALLQKWIRDVHDIHIGIQTGVGDKAWWSFILIKISTNDILHDSLDNFDSYEKALEAGLVYTLNLINK